MQARSAGVVDDLYVHAKETLTRGETGILSNNTAANHPAKPVSWGGQHCYILQAPATPRCRRGFDDDYNYERLQWALRIR